jgi:hypothetical protein
MMMLESLVFERRQIYDPTMLCWLAVLSVVFVVGTESEAIVDV